MIERDLTKFQCPACGFQTGVSSTRTCPSCGYRGDWVQPGETKTYAQQMAEKAMDALPYLHHLSDVDFDHFETAVREEAQRREKANA